MSAAVGDIAGIAYEGLTHRTKDYAAVKLFSSRAKFTDDTILTFACAEAFLDGKDMAWLSSHDMKPYGSFGNGSAMRCSSAGWLATSESECIRLATETASPTHNHPEGIKGAVATALAIFYLKNGADKAFIRERVLNAYYPEWSGRTYEEIHDNYTFNSTCPGTVGPAILSFDASEDYVDCIRLAISLGGDADTLAAIAGPMAYAFYREMPDSLVYGALKKLPDWMLSVNERFDKRITEIHAE